MNSEVLKRDLFERVFDEVKVFDVWEENVLDIDYTSQTYDTKCVGLKVCIDRNERFKPILFPTSALTKPIQIANYNNSEPFVPLVEIKKIEMSKDPYSLGVVNWVEIYHKFGEFNLDNTPFFIIELLKQWHINYRLSPEQFIEVTDSFNPYK